LIADRELGYAVVAVPAAMLRCVTPPLVPTTGIPVDVELAPLSLTRGAGIGQPGRRIWTCRLGAFARR